MAQEWKERVRPVRLEKRYEFPDYDALREFLDQAADISEKEALYPDMGFGKDYVNITVNLDDGEEALSDKHHGFAKQLDELNNQARG